MPWKTVTIVLTCRYLHNLIRYKNVEAHVQGVTDVENMNTGEFVNADWRSEPMLVNLQLLNGKNNTNIAKQIRTHFVITLIQVELLHCQSTYSTLKQNKL